MKLINPRVLLGAFGVVVSVFPSAVSAQTGEIPVKAIRVNMNGGLGIPARSQRLPTEYQVQVFRVQNVKASVMAWWLDPIHNETPLEFQAIDQWKGQVIGMQGHIEPDKRIAMAEWQERFPGLQAVTPQDDQNQMLVVGTPESFAGVAEQLAVLDKPLRQVEVAAQFVETDPENIRQLGLSLMNFETENAAPKIPAMGFGKSGPAIKEKLDALVAAGKAKVINAPRVTIINNQYGFIGSTGAIPATVGVKDEKGRFHELDTKPIGVNNAQLSLGMQSTFLAKAKINGDDTITLSIEPSRHLNLSAALQQIPLQTIERRQAGCTIRDGEFFALNGATYGGTVNDVINGVKGKNVIMIVTARIIRRPWDVE